MDKYYDIVVVGAGPASSMFSANISDKYKVLRLDGSFGREKPCGGLLAPQSVRFFREEGIEIPKSIIVEPEVRFIRTMDLGTGRERNYPRNYLNMDRNLFDNWLKGMAGHNVETADAKAIDIKKDKESYIVFFRDERGMTRNVSCRYVIGADGAGSIVRKLLRKKDSITYYVSIQERYPLRNEPVFACVFDRATSPSCSWLFTKGDEISFGGAFVSTGARNNFMLQKEKLKKDFGFSLSGAIDSLACMVYRPKRKSDFLMGEGNAFLVGEAAGLISPASFEGISFALKSGKALAQAFETDNILDEYIRRTKALRSDILKKRFKRPFMYNQTLRNLVFITKLKTVR